ncbi:hypothetical protein H2248_012286 [Termitomyces sp. 'cryptogamus']|nr:hypothetical protein H2248_012286 [Termitomyces sp. 'cryptogamus']
MLRRKVPRVYSGYDWDTSEDSGDSIAHYSDFTRAPSSSAELLEPRKDLHITTPIATGPCVVSHSTEHVRAIYLLPQLTNHHTLSRLEYALGLPWGSINVNSKLNILTLSDELCDSFTNGSWILLPQREILELLRENPEKPVLDLLNKPTYDYTLLSIDNKSSIRRYVNVERTATVEEYHHPISTFPTITSSVHPVFVIWNVAHQLRRLSIVSQYIKAHNTYHRPLSKTVQLSFQWSQPIPQKSVFYTHPASPSSQDNLDVMISYRADRAPFEHALHHAMKGETCLDEEVIRLFLGTKHRRRVRKRRERFIKEWVYIVSEEEFASGPIPEARSSVETKSL